MNNKILFIGSQWVKKQSQHFTCQKERLFPTQLNWQWSMNMIKVRSSIFQQSFSTFTILLVEASSQTGLSRHLSDCVFGLVSTKIQKLWGSSFFSKRSKFQLDFKKAVKKSKKVFCFWDNFIWIDIVKLSLLRAGYF